MVQWWSNDSAIMVHWWCNDKAPLVFVWYCFTLLERLMKATLIDSQVSENNTWYLVFSRCCNLFCIYGIVKKNFERTQLAPTSWRTQLRTLFHIYCWIAGVRSLFDSKDLSWRNMFCRAYEIKWIWNFWVELDLYCSFGFKRGFPIDLRVLWAVGKTVRTPTLQAILRFIIQSLT